MQFPSPLAHRPSRRTRLRALVALCALGACLALAACGSSGSSTSASTTTGTGTSASKAGSGSSRFTALRSCLQKQGITLPARPSGGAGAPGGPGGTGAPGFPGGMSQSLGWLLSDPSFPCSLLLRSLCFDLNVRTASKMFSTPSDARETA